MTAKPFLTITQMARRCNCAEITIRRMITRGELQCVRLGRAIRIPQEAADAFLSAQVSYET